MSNQNKGNQNNQRSMPGAHIPPHMAAADPSMQSLSREQVAHGEARKPRVPMNTGEFVLEVPPSLLDPKKKYYWFEDNGKGRIERAKAAWWEHVVDPETGTNYSRRSGDRMMYLMCIDKIYWDEDEALRERNYRASIGEDADKPLDGGIESYVPSGHDNKIKVNSDPFA